MIRTRIEIAILGLALVLAGCHGLFEDRPPDDPCDGVDCSGHGECILIEDGSRTACYCDTGYHAEELECVLVGADGDADSDADSDIDSDTADADTAENTEALCSDDIDNDGNGFVDCDDWNCRAFAICCERTEDHERTCDDDRDNDCDGNIDDDDRDCDGVVGREDDDLSCSDGIDNDGDTFVDCDDYDCADTEPCRGP